MTRDRSLRIYLSYIAPQFRLEWALYAFVLLCALRPWILTWVLFPHDSAFVRTIYRSPDGEAEYFPMINALGKGELGEFAIYESRGAGIQTFPLASIAYHSLGAAFLGPLWGYMAADVVVTFIFFLVLRAWCRLFSTHELWTSFLAALYISGLTQIMDGLGGKFLHIGALWGGRIPRPFACESYLVGGMILLVWLAWKPQAREKTILWLLLGAIFSFCLQSSFFALPPLGIGAAFIVLQWWWEDRSAFFTILSRIGYAGFGFLILTLPFIYQRTFGSPEGMLHWGLFPADRWLVWFHTPWYNDLSVVGGLIIIGILALASAKKYLDVPPIPRRVFILLVTLQVTAFLAIPLTATLTGKLIQPIHSFLTTSAIQTSLLLLLVSSIGPGLLGKVPHRSLMGAVLLLLGFCLNPYHVIHRQLLTGPMPSNMFSPSATEYHHAFASLANELDRDIYKDDLVVATTDLDVYIYWVGFRGRYAFFPDVNFTTDSDFDIENRLLWFAREEKFDSENLKSFLIQNTFLLLGCQYQFSPLYHLKPLEDYSPQNVNSYKKMPLDFNPFHLALPTSKIQELQDRYTQILAKNKNEEPRLDLIILSNFTLGTPLPDPPSSRYVLTYHDDYFRIWKAVKEVTP
jgi:hypothetical protein